VAKRLPIGVPQPSRTAIELVKSSSFAKFDETVEVAVRLGVDPLDFLHLYPDDGRRRPRPRD